MKLLLHTCCAPCSVYCIKSLRKEGIEPVVYWFNPNIHPYIEYKTRRDTLKEYTKSIGINAIFDENYGLREFCKNVVDDLENRCVKYCYRVRLEQTAKYAKENGLQLLQTKVGDRYVLEKMLKEGYNLGGEQSGHVILLDYNPTGDGILTSLMLIKTILEEKKKASELGDLIKLYPQVLINAKVN